MSDPHVMVFSACYGCGIPFGYNPHLVPSIPIGPDGQPKPRGDRKPICRNCVERVNPLRRKNNLQEIEILPGAYDPLPEGEL